MSRKTKNANNEKVIKWDNVTLYTLKIYPKLIYNPLLGYL